MQAQIKTGGPWIKGILLALLSGIAFSLFMNLFVTAINVPDLDFFPGISDTTIENEGSSIAMQFLLSILLAPLIEELIFRKLLFNKCRERLSFFPAMIIVSVLFAVLHMNLRTFTYALFFSVLLCWIVESSCNFYFCVAAHLAANGIAFGFNYMEALSSFVEKYDLVFLVIGFILVILCCILWKIFDRKGDSVWKKY